MTKNIPNLTRIIVLIFFLLLSCGCFGQIKASYNKTDCNCINVKLKNIGSDTIYLFAQSYDIHYRDSCFAYYIIYSEKFSKSYLNISYFDNGTDGLHSFNNIFVLYPDSISNFGARSNKKMISDSLLIDCFVYSMPIIKTETLRQTKNRIDKIINSESIEGLGKWRQYYCPDSGDTPSGASLQR